MASPHSQELELGEGVSGQSRACIVLPAHGPKWLVASVRPRGASGMLWDREWLPGGHASGDPGQEISACGVAQ